MLFNSYTFLLFFIVVLLVSRWMGNWTARKALLLGSSYLFYMAWSPPFVLLLLLSTVVDWYLARWISGSRSSGRKKAFLFLSLFVNLGMLSLFKYGDFLVENLGTLFAAAGVEFQQGRMGLVLPVGISFYTFQTLSYTIDVYRGKLQPGRSFLDYALYVTFFPQLVAGPIVRASEFLPQCEEPRKGSGRQVGWGVALLVIGLFSKVVLADALTAPTVETVFGHAGELGFVDAWMGALAFSMQIFFDFFGYSTCAVGAGLCLGFDLPDNFRFPYASLGFTDFWRRWHISLSTWLRDYLYIPLGGSRGGAARTTANLMLTMLLGGLWHGASWMFVIWGGLHGTYLVGERLLRRTALARLPFWGGRTGRALLLLSTYGLVCVAWVFFRASSLASALSLCGSMLDPRGVLDQFRILATRFAGGEVGVGDLALLSMRARMLIAVLAAGTLLVHHRLRDSSLEEFFSGLRPWVRATLLGALLYLTFVSMGGEDHAFIYFQF